MNPSPPIRAAVIGLGRAGWNIHVRTMQQREDFHVVAVADPDKDRQRQAEEEAGAQPFDDLSSLLKGCDAELIVVATASVDHANHSIAALEAGRHVLTEKPMATAFADADRMLAAAERTGKILTVHQSRRWAEDFTFIQQMLNDERLGDVFFIRSGGYGFRRRNDWQTLQKYGGGLLNNNDVHAVDQCVILMESPIVDVFGDLQQILQPGDTEDHVKVVMRGENGRVIDLELTSACAASLPSWTLMGTRGSLTVTGSGKAVLRYVKGELQPLEVIDTPLATGRKYGVTGGEEIEFEEVELEAKAQPGRAFYDQLYDAIRNGTPPPVDPATSRETIRVLSEARKGTQFSQ
ncbi:MAG: Gfo/Idh/MocA family oxidoreductase [Candidatus Poribacteria bacterium]|nr:Gfo/Idh/MocA family oxidoreductase [Candidatus Poribacteria bacterium]